MSAPYTLVDAWEHRVLVESAASDLRRRFPGVTVWFGEATRRWWAVVESVAGRARLVEAGNPYDLCQLIGSARADVARSTSRAAKIPVRSIASPADPPRGSRRRAHGGRHARQ